MLFFDEEEIRRHIKHLDKLNKDQKIIKNIECLEKFKDIPIQSCSVEDLIKKYCYVLCNNSDCVQAKDILDCINVKINRTIVQECEYRGFF